MKKIFKKVKKVFGEMICGTVCVLQWGEGATEKPSHSNQSFDILTTHEDVMRVL